MIKVLQGGKIRLTNRLINNGKSTDSCWIYEQITVKTPGYLTSTWIYPQMSQETYRGTLCCTNVMTDIQMDGHKDRCMDKQIY